MNIRARTASLLVAGGLVAASLGIAAPAAAEETTYHDGADTPASLTDILRVKADHRAERLVVKITFPDLRKKSDGGPSSIGIFVDTRKARKGPEFRLGTGLQSGTDYQLVRMRDWKAVGQPLNCQHDLDLQFGKDRLVFKAARGCLGNPERLRIGAKMVDHFDASHPVVDWMRKSRTWTAWVASA